MYENAPSASDMQSALPLADSDVTAQSVESDCELQAACRPLVFTGGVGPVIKPHQNECAGWNLPPAGDCTVLHHHP